MAELDLAIAKRRQKLEEQENGSTASNMNANNNESSSSSYQEYEEPYTTGDASNSVWTLYYSEDGYPYYYNHYTGESQWCYDEQYTENSNVDADDGYYNNDTYSSKQYVTSDFDDETPGNYADEESDESEEESEDDVDDSDENEEGSAESDEDSDSSEESNSEEDEMESKFAEYLKTAAGEALLRKEQNRLERKLKKRQLKAEQDKTYAAKQSIRRSTSTKKRDDIKYLSGLVPFKELTPEKQNKNFRDNAYNESNIYPSNVTGPPSAPTSSRLVPPSAPTSSRLVPPSIPTSSRVVGNGLLSDRSQYKEEHPFQPRVEPNSTQNSMNNSNKKTSVFDEENYYHDKASRNEPPLGEDSSTSSDDDFSDDSDLDEIEGPIVPEWLQWSNMKENARRMVNATIIAGNQWVIRGFGSDADLTQTMQQAANVSISAINGVTANATSLVSYANDFLERNHVYEFLNSTIEIPIPSSLGGNNGESDGTEATAGEGSTRSLQSAVNSTASALWSYVSYGVATSTSAVWSVVNDRIQTLIDEIDNDRLREEQRRQRALEEERKEAAKMSSIEGGLGEEIVSTNANILPSVSSRLSSGYSVVTPVKDTAPHAPTSLIKPDSNVLSSPLPVPVTPIFAHGIENPVADGKDSTDEVCDDTHASMNEPVVEHGSPTGENDVEVETGHISTVENIQAVETGLVSVADNESTDVDQSDPVADVGSPLETTTPSNSNKNTTSKKNKKNKKGKK